MGSYNLTCFASRQTITPGDNCFVIPVAQRATFYPSLLRWRDQTLEAYGISDSVCFPNAFWTPIGAALEAIYDDYGRVQRMRPGNPSCPSQ